MTAIVVPTLVRSLGFTGSRKGLSERQRYILHQILEECKPEVAVHGGCIGADTDFHNLCIRHETPVIKVYQSTLVQTWGDRLFLTPTHKTRIIWMGSQPPLDRNWDIVRDRDLVVACPDTAQETLRSGTWATVRYAQQLERTIIVIKPYETEES